MTSSCCRHACKASKCARLVPEFQQVVVAYHNLMPNVTSPQWNNNGIPSVTCKQIPSWSVIPAPARPLGLNATHSKRRDGERVANEMSRLKVSRWCKCCVDIGRWWSACQQPQKSKACEAAENDITHKQQKLSPKALSLTEEWEAVWAIPWKPNDFGYVWLFVEEASDVVGKTLACLGCFPNCQKILLKKMLVIWKKKWEEAEFLDVDSVEAYAQGFHLAGPVWPSGIFGTVSRGPSLKIATGTGASSRVGS